MEDAKYSLIGDHGERRDGKVEKNDVSSLKEVALDMQEPDRERTLSVNSVTQTGNGSILKLPRLHIPGENGELAGYSANDEGSEESPNAIVTPEMLQQAYAQVNSIRLQLQSIQNQSRMHIIRDSLLDAL